MPASVAGIAEAISQATQASFSPEKPVVASGGCINQSYKLTDNTRSFFVKTNHASRLAMFEAEAAGLNDILATHTIRVPQPVCSGTTGEQAYLVLEYLALSEHGDSARLGRQLARLHRNSAPRFGWRRDNTIGSTPQINTWSGNWIAFLGEQRLGHQLRLAAENGCRKQLIAQGERLISRLKDFFPGHQPTPALLHGDLWGGNAAYLASGEPVIFDPAVYFGDREADLAMTELFGGFGSDFTPPTARSGR